MLKTTAMLTNELKSYAGAANRLGRLVTQGKYFPVVRGLYETDRNVAGYLLAGSIYGPSYISFDFALSQYGIIPEAVYTITCASYNKKKKKTYSTLYGNFTYRDVPENVFYLGIRLIQQGEYFYRIASPEKALADKLYTLPPIKNNTEMRKLLEENLRIELISLCSLDIDLLKEISEKYHSTNVKKLFLLIRRLKNEHCY